MIGRLPAIHLVLFCFFLSFARNTAAQPTLPDITGTFNSGTVTLTWNCQYSAIKAISVLRSADSVNNYEVTGYVKKTGKGVQRYEDKHPLTGYNYYKLLIAFKSGLTWRSNRFGIIVAGKEQKESNAGPERTPVVKQPGENVPQAKAERESDQLMPKPKPDSCAKSSPKPRLSVSLGPDSTQPAFPPEKPMASKPKIVLTQDGQIDDNTPIFIRSRYIYTDTANGHVNMFLPDDVAGHHYSVKFYDNQNHLLFDLPRINVARTVIDKRNFQRTGVYRFVIRKDYTELESGFIIVEL